MSVQFSSHFAGSCAGLVIVELSVPPSSVPPDFPPDLPKALLVDPVIEGSVLNRTHLVARHCFICPRIFLWLLQLSESFPRAKPKARGYQYIVIWGTLKCPSLDLQRQIENTLLESHMIDILWYWLD